MPDEKRTVANIEIKNWYERSYPLHLAQDLLFAHEETEGQNCSQLCPVPVTSAGGSSVSGH